MAIMYPNNIDLYSPTKSERLVYNKLKEQLNDNVKVFYSVSWAYVVDGERKISEADFLIFDPRFGFLTMEVKGGAELEIRGNKWYLKYNDGGERPLERSPYEQAEESMYYIRNYYYSQYNFPFGGISGAIACFPNYNITNPEILNSRPLEMTISEKDMNNLDTKIQKAFMYWRRHKPNRVSFTAEQKDKFLSLVNKRIQISASLGSLINYQKPQFEIINRVQNNIVYMLKNYKKMFITGGAGTGKSWIAMKFAREYNCGNFSVLLTCLNDNLSEFFSDNLKDCSNVDVIAFDKLITGTGINCTKDELFSLDLTSLLTTKNYKKYDVIIVDEAQDFSVECAFAINMFLKSETDSRLHVFFDKTQNIFDRDFKDGFMINNPEFCLRENLRNTAKIYSWAISKTNYLTDVITNPIEGVEPLQYTVRNALNCKNRISSILKELITDEKMPNENVVVIADDDLILEFTNSDVASWKLKEKVMTKNDIRVSSVSDYKGLESDVVIYVRKKNNKSANNYVAYTRAKYFLYEIIIE